MRQRRAVLASLAVMVTACTSTLMSTTWKNPEYAGRLPKKVLVVAFVPNQATSEQIQDQLASKLSAVEVLAVPVSRVAPAGASLTQEALANLIHTGGFDGLVVTRYKKTTENVNAVGYGWGWGGYVSAYGPYAPGYWSVTPVEQMETSLFDAKGNGQLIWTGTSNTSVSGAGGTAISNADVAHYAAVIVGRLSKDMISG